MLQIGVDVGGTFTDLVSWDGQTLRTHKLPSTPPRFEQAVLGGIAHLRAAAHPVHVVHGSTVATNALLQRAGAPIALITTDGFKDTLLIGRQDRPRLYELHVRRPAALVPPEHCFTVRERVDARGSVVEALSDDEVARVVAAVRAAGLEHAAVCLLFSFINPTHERRLGEQLGAAGVTVSLSCDVLPEFREYERASTTAINATLRPVVQEYLYRLQTGIQGASLRIMHGGGGTFTAHAAAHHAAQMVLSGPAGGVVAAAYVAKLAGQLDCVTYDMGGTSTDVALIRGGRPQWAANSRIDGMPIGVPMFDIHTIGAGGGSIAFVDEGGALRVGPRSAGTHPGPACYGRGGIEPTVTDANVVLKRIAPERFLGGAMRLDAAAAMHAVARLAEKLQLDPVRAALGIIAVAQNSMSQAVRAVTARRGIDPRDLALISFGGAGGLHACAMAESLGMELVIVPPLAGVLSALGMIVAREVQDASRTVLHLGEALDDAEIARQIESLRLHAAGADHRIDTIELTADVRFAGQSHELLVPFTRPVRAEICARFTAEYERIYGRSPRDRRVEIVTLRVRASGAEPRIALPSLSASAGNVEVIELIDDGGKPAAAQTLDRASLAASHARAGPILLLDSDATTFVPVGWVAACDPGGTVTLRPAHSNQK